MDTLTVKGLGSRIDGVYECDLSALLITGEMLVSEAAAIREFCGARGYDIATGFLENDWTVRAAVAMVVLARNDVTLDANAANNAKVGAFTFTLSASEEEAETENPPGEGATPSKNGGGFGSPTLAATPETDQTSIGPRASAA